MGEVARHTTGRLALALGLTLAFVVIEAVAGLWADSLALLTDAAHNLTDVAALGLSWYALRLTGQPANSGKTFGYHRAGILVAFINSTTLGLIAVGIFYEAYRRLLAPREVDSGLLVGVGLMALVLNAGTAWLVHRGSEHDLNLRSAYLHLLGDVLSTLGAVAAGVVIFFSGMNWLDPAVSLFIGALILWNAWGILREALDILLEGTPRDIDMRRMVRDLLAVAGVRGVHDLHVWSITRSLRALSAHVVTDDIAVSAGAAIQRDINALLSHDYAIAHATLQLECDGCEPDGLYCNISAAGHSQPHAAAPAESPARQAS